MLPVLSMLKGEMAAVYTYILTGEEARSLEKLLSESGFEPKMVEYAEYAFAKPGVFVSYFKKRSKLLIQGKSAENFIKSTPILHGLLSEKKAENQSSSTHEPARGETICDKSPHFGIDESGKGDYFGPLVVAGVYTSSETAKKLVRMGVCDSKLIKSDIKIHRLAQDISKLPDVVYEVLCISPRHYNELYGEMKNLNTLLAWGHAHVISALHAKVPTCPRALSDQFAKPWVLQAALKKQDVHIELEQKTQGESDVAVAAASILARDRFVSWLNECEKRSGLSFPKGVGAGVMKAARTLLKEHGEEKLAQLAKLHFKLTKQLIADKH